MRVLTIIGGILLIFTGIWCFVHPGATFLSLAFMVGIMMLINSVIQASAYLQGRRGNKSDNNGWILADALMCFILSILVLSNQLAADVAIPMVFGMWIMFSGILRIVTASHIDRDGKKSNFMWTLITGILAILVGIYCFVNPIVGGFAIAILLGLVFLFQGIGILELGIHMPHKQKKN